MAKKSINELRKETRFQNVVEHEPIVYVNSVEPTVVNGRVVNKPVQIEFDYRKQFEGLKVSDFFLENLIASGSVDKLKEVSLSGNSLSIADDVTTQISNINISEDE